MEVCTVKRVLILMLVLALIAAFSAAVFAQESPQIETPPPEIEEIIEEYQTVYRLTINYIYLNGDPAAPTHVEQLNVGEAFNVPSPELPGYTPTQVVVSGTMPSRNLEYTVIYIPNAPGTDTPTSFLRIDDYETALGFGVSFMHVGICIE